MTGDGGWMPVPPRERSTASDDWKKTLIRSKSGDPKPLLANAVSALRTAPEWVGILAFDEFSLSVVSKSTPVFGGQAGTWSDQQDRLTAVWLQEAGIGVSVEVAGQAIQAVAMDRPFHPVREYLDGLRWDGTRRIEGWLNLYMGVEPTSYSTAVGERYLRSAVARVMNPGCKADCCLILEGQQGIKKSTALRTLGRPWFTDELADLGSKDAALQTRGIWIIEIAELDGMTRTEIGKIKAFMSRGTDRFRPPYGRHVIESPRQCIFAGSVNQTNYLRDETGGRRFWPVACTRVLIDELGRDKDMLWAEAVHTYKAGAAWWLESLDLVREAAEEQSARYEETAWDSMIEDWLEERLAAGFASVSAGEALALCIQKPQGAWGRPDEMRVANAFRRFGWERRRETSGAKRCQRWFPPQTGPTSGGREVGREVGRD
jgi:predicted P-loop ATPase